MQRRVRESSGWREAAALVLLVSGVLLAVRLREVLGVLFLGLVLGVSFTPVTDTLQRHRVPRLLTVLLVYAVLIGVIGALSWFTAAAVASDSSRFAAVASSQYDELAGRLELPSQVQLTRALHDQALALVGPLGAGAFGILTALVDVVTVLLVGLLVTITKDRMRMALLALVAPARRTQVSLVLDHLGSRLRRTVLGLLLAMITVGVLAYAGFVVLRMPFPIILAMITGLFELLPIVGPWVAFVPVVLVGLTEGARMVIAVSVMYLLIHLVEANVIVPLLHGRMNQVPALLLVSAVLIGAALMGVLGALIAIPAAVILHALYFEVLVPYLQAEEPL